MGTPIWADLSMVDVFKLVELGVAIASLVAIVLVVRIFVGFMQNHMEHNTKALRELSVAIDQMLGFLDRRK